MNASDAASKLIFRHGTKPNLSLVKGKSQGGTLTVSGSGQKIRLSGNVPVGKVVVIGYLNGRNMKVLDFETI
jgi:hypothetical protein